jgi:hypothetical protein
MKKSKTKFYTFLLLIIGMSFGVNSFAQTVTPTPTPAVFNHRCGNENVDVTKMTIISGNQPTFRSAAATGPYLIPVVVHVLYDAAHANDPAHNISYQQIQWQINMLNMCFQKQLTTYSPRATNTDIRFCLAQTAMGATWTNSNEKGVMRHQVPTSTVSHTLGLVGRNTLLSATGVPTAFPFENYLNIWLIDEIVDTTGVYTGTVTPNTNIMAYSNFPGTLSAGNPLDGVVSRQDIFGSNRIPNSENILMSQLDQGSILAHEVGHYLNLLHTFTGGCVGTNSATCSNQGDLICDTPPTNLTNTGLCWGSGVSTCVDNLPVYGGVDQPDMFENFMSYADDNCLSTFTLDQSTVMQGVLNVAWPTGRADMVSASNLAATGLTTASVCCPTGVTTPYFITNITSCSAVTFSVPLPPCNMNNTYQWNFGDGTTFTAIATNTVSHTYTLAGRYTPTLTVIGTDGTTLSWYKVLEIGTFGKSSSKTVCNNSVQGVNFHVQTTWSSGTYTMAVNFNGSTTIKTFSINANELLVYQHTDFMNVEANIPVSLSPTVTLPAQIIYTVNLIGSNICMTTFIDTFTVVNCCNNLITNGNFSNGTNNFTTNGAWPSVQVVNANPMWSWLRWPYLPSLLMDSPYCGVPSTCTSIAVYDTPFHLEAANNYRFNFQCYGGQPAYFKNGSAIYKLDTLFINPQIVDNSGNIIRDFGTLNLMDLSDTTWHHYDFAFNNPTFTGTGHLVINQVKNFYSADAIAQGNSYGYGYDYALDEINVRAVSPTFTIGVTPSTTTVCAGAAASTFTTGTASTYSWNTGATTSTISVSPSITTTYSVIGTSILNCTATAQSTVNVNPLPSLTITSSSATICAGQSITLTVSGANTYSWSTGASTTSISVSPSVTTTYTVTGTNTITGCINTRTISVIVTPNPTVTISNATICVGSSTVLTAGGATTYNWSTGATTNTISVTPTITTIYTATGTTSGCTNVKTATVTVTPNPTVSVNNATICAGSSTVLTASGATTYSWNTGATTNTISVTPTVTTIYTVTGTSNGCTNIKTATVTVTPNPTLSVSNRTICAGTSTVLTVSGATTYSWNTGATTNTISVSPSSTTVYTVTGTTSGCSNTKTVQVTVTPNPTVAVSNATICSGTSTVLTVSGATTYSWNTGVTTNTITVSPVTTTNYTVTGTTNGCINTKTVSVIVNPSPTLTVVANPMSICVGQTSTLTVSGATTYSWSTASTNTLITVTPSTTTTYTAYGFFANGCSSTKTVSVIVGPVTPTITASSSTVNVCSGNSTTLTASGATNYTWSPISVYTSTATVTPTAAIIYTLSGNSGAGCNTATTTLLVNPIISTLCCTAANSSITTSTITAGAYTTVGTVIDVSGVITFTGNTSYNGYTFRMKPNALLRVMGEYTLTLTNCKLYSCSELWDGIYLIAWNNDVHGHLVLNNTTVEDMYNGIVVEGNNLPVLVPTTGLLINSTASTLNKNYISMQFRNIDGTVVGPSLTYTTTPYPFSMKTTTISSYSSTTSPGSSLKPSSTYTYAYNTWAGGATSSTNTPFVNFPRTFKGIVLNNMRALAPLVIGDSTTAGSTNLFDNMDFGVHGTEASAKVHNNYFKNITGSTKQTANGESFPAFGPNEIGIAVAMTHTSTNVHSLTVGTHTVVPSSNPYPKGNKFEDCNRGVYAISCKNVYAKANTFSATATSTVPPYGVDAYYYYKNQSAIWINAQADYFTLSFNYIQNFSSGIYSSHTTTNTSMRPHIFKNTIGAPASTGFCKQAIQVAQVGGSNFTNGYINIDNNSIANVYNGILAGGVANGIWIKNNGVSVEPKTKVLGTTSTAINTAIKVANSNYAMVQANSVTNSGAVPTTSTTANYITGIHVSGSTNAKVECNNAYHLGRCFVFQAGCGNSSWKVNSMSDSYRGLEMQLAAVINNQGAPTYTGTPNLSANTWATLTQHTFVLGTTNVNTLSKLYLLSGGNTQPTLNFAVSPSPSYSTGTGFGINNLTSGTSYTCNSGNAQRIANGDNGGNINSGGNNQKTAGTSTDSLTELTNLATANEDSYEVFADEMMYQNQQFVYQLIEQDSINPDKNSTLSAFYNNNQNTAIDKLTEAQIAIANFDISGASAANSSAPVISAIEQKQQRANELVLKYMNDRNYVFTDNEKTDLKNMANECLAKGDYVTHARNLVDVFTHTTILYEDECEAEANASRKKKPENIVNNNTLFNLFPNPNNGTMQLDYKLGSYSNAKFSLFDITGKLIQSINIETNEGSLNINEQNLRNGVYFYTILVGEKNIKTDKIVIIK